MTKKIYYRFIDINNCKILHLTNVSLLELESFFLNHLNINKNSLFFTRDMPYSDELELKSIVFLNIKEASINNHYPSFKKLWWKKEVQYNKNEYIYGSDCLIASKNVKPSKVDVHVDELWKNPNELFKNFSLIGYCHDYDSEFYFASESPEVYKVFIDFLSSSNIIIESNDSDLYQ